MDLLPMGPTIEILIESDDAATLDQIDQVLRSAAYDVTPTWKRRVWTLRFQERPFDVHVTATPVVTIVAGCNQTEDYAAIRELASAIATATGGVVSDPEK